MTTPIQPKLTQEDAADSAILNKLRNGENITPDEAIRYAQIMILHANRVQSEVAGNNTMYVPSLRDWLAGMAMQGALSSGIDMPLKDFAKWTYSVSDEMMQARVKK